MGSGTKRTPFISLRLTEVRSGKTWHSYLTSVLDPEILPPYVVADLYRRRWRIEEAFNRDDDNATDSGSAYLFAVAETPEKVPEPSAVVGPIAIGALGVFKRFLRKQKR